MKIKCIKNKRVLSVALFALLMIAGWTKTYAQESRTTRTNGELDYSTYDWQTNATAITRTIVWPDGKINFGYTMASQSNYADRGTGIGTYDAMNDVWIPSDGRVEAERTGFGSIARYGQNGIVVAAHTTSQCGIYIIQDKDNIVSNSAPAVSYLNPTYAPSWPNLMTSGPNRNIIHVVAASSSSSTSIPGAEGVNQPILYFRSQDGGQTWDKQNIVLPFMGPDYCINWGANKCYWMETTEDNCLALVVNNPWSDGMVIYSYDDGETWERKVFYKHPNPFGSFNPAFLYPRYTSCQWDSQHGLHVLYEFNGCLGEPGILNYFPAMGGVAYWNETLPYNENGTTQSAIPGNLTPGLPFVMDSAYLYNDIYNSWWYYPNATHEMWPEYIGYLPALDDDGNWEDPYTATQFNIVDRFLHGNYYNGVCSFPVLCMVPGSDDMVAVWCALDENHTDGSGNFYYKLFASYSSDGGSHWSNMKHLTNSSNFHSKECVYPQAAVVNNKLVIACQMDGTTGTFVQGNDSDPYDNYYQGLTFDLGELFLGQSQQLAAGWNWWSTYIELNGINGLAMLESSLGENGVIIKAQDSFVQNQEGQWAGPLTMLHNERGYKISVTEECTTSLAGAVALPENHPITVQPNWNWIGYPVTIQQTVGSALANFQPLDNDIIKGQNGFAMYRTNQWLPTNFMMKPGEAYMYNSTASGTKTLVFAQSKEALSSLSEECYWQPDRQAYPDNLSLIATVEIEGMEQRNEQLELGAFVNGECRGSAHLYYVEPIDRYVAFLTVTGQDDEQVEFRLMDESKATSTSHDHIIFHSNAIIGNLDHPFTIHFSSDFDTLFSAITNK